MSNNNIKISPICTPSQPTPPASPQQATASKRLLQEALTRTAPYPMIVIPEKGYWIDGTDHDCHYDHRGQPFVTHGTWRAKIETDDTAKCYRRFFVGRVSTPFFFNLAFFSIFRFFVCVAWPFVIVQGPNAQILSNFRLKRIF